MKYLLILIACCSCTTIRNGYTYNYRRTEIQKAVVITSSNHCNDRIYYEGKTIPSEFVMYWKEWSKTYSKKDTILITDELFLKSKFKL